MAELAEAPQEATKTRDGVSAQGMVLAILVVWTLAAVGMTMGLAEATLAALVVWLVGSLVAVVMKLDPLETPAFSARDEELAQVEQRLFDAILDHPWLTIDIAQVEASLIDLDASGVDVFRRNLGTRMRALLASSPEPDRSVVTGYFLGGRSESDLSEELRIDLGEVKRVVVDAVERLCDHVSQSDADHEESVPVTEAA
ncbi:MAG: hypothetical protein JJLCMIEE_01364 [Acidimicrobiales bacterium]|nr:MAG: hypothetical protein EDR02_17350 [Actinomycetota bacterium]MBV6508304.1 hypothetical protein [Acidimicrobiales bacterium]RIK07087.1 MAG: hypothetical protein DCC48_04655 [Acidobacteriota bacterium]